MWILFDYIIRILALILFMELVSALRVNLGNMAIVAISMIVVFTCTSDRSIAIDMEHCVKMGHSREASLLLVIEIVILLFKVACIAMSISALLEIFSTILKMVAVSCGLNNQEGGSSLDKLSFYAIGMLIFSFSGYRVFLNSFGSVIFAPIVSLSPSFDLVATEKEFNLYIYIANKLVFIALKASMPLFVVLFMLEILGGMLSRIGLQQFSAEILITKPFIGMMFVICITTFCVDYMMDEFILALDKLSIL